MSDDIKDGEALEAISLDNIDHRNKKQYFFLYISLYILQVICINIALASIY